MTKRRKKSLTKRERECKRIAREKAVRKHMSVWWRRACYAGMGVAGCAVIGLSAWEYFDKGISRTAERIVDGGYQLTARAGFSVTSMYLEGRSRTPIADVNFALGVKRGDPILGLPLEDIRARLEALPTVKFAAIERALPGTIHVRLEEREPVAVWQHDGQLSLIDDEGKAMNDLALADFPELPLVIGAGAPKHVTEVLALLAAEPTIAPQVAAALRVSDRRWNMRLKNGIEVKLPEENARDAWTRVAQLERSQGILTRGVKSVDLRQPGRTVVKLPAAAATAKET